MNFITTYSPFNRPIWDNYMSLFNNTSKEKETVAMNKRNTMNNMKKGMHIKVEYPRRKGTIAAFDYTRLLIGVVFDDEPSHKIAWIDPYSVTVCSESISAKLTEIGKCVQEGFVDGILKSLYPMPKKVIYDPEAGVTVVLWNDGKKTIVRAAKDETPDIYDAFCAAFCKRIYGTNSALKRELKKILVINEKNKK